MFKASSDNLEWKISLSLNYGKQHIRSALLLLSLGKLTNHFWKVKFDAGHTAVTKRMNSKRLVVFLKKCIPAKLCKTLGNKNREDKMPAVDSHHTYCGYFLMILLFQ